MSGLFGMGRPQPSSAEKIAAAEQEMDMVADMFSKFVSSASPLQASADCDAQTHKVVPQEMHSPNLQRRRTEQGRRCLHRPLHGQVLRCAVEGVGVVATGGY